MGRLQVVRDGAFRRDEGLRAALAAIVAASFVDEAGRLERTFERSDTLYLLRDDRDEVMCFFMVAWEPLRGEGREVPALYTDLCAARTDLKSKGLVLSWHHYRDGKLLAGWNYWNHLGLVEGLRCQGQESQEGGPGPA